jgi:hypothetical protein
VVFVHVICVPSHFVEVVPFIQEYTPSTINNDNIVILLHEELMVYGSVEEDSRSLSSLEKCGLQ